MKKQLKFMITAIVVVMFNLIGTLNAQYLNHSQFSGRIRSLATQYPAFCSVKSLVKTFDGSDIWLISIGTGEKDSKPAIVLAGGVDGRYLFSRELALGFAEKILKASNENDIKQLLEKITFYILPDVSPEASAQYFANLKYERFFNSRSTDDDRDFSFGEDPFEDLNNDGFITLMRVEDPAGDHVICKEDERIMVKADLSKGETGKYFVYPEGIDNDKDGLFNEDGEGGVNFNRNFTFNYEPFGKHSGEHPVSEPEVKAVADFLFDRFNVFAVITFGPQDNLGEPMKTREGPEVTPSSQGQPADPGMMRRERVKITSILKSDEIINKLVSEKYHEITGLKGAPPVSNEPGNFMEWAYFHYGRYSFGTPGWWFPREKGKNPEAQFLKYAEKNNITDAFVPWTPFNHPDFPGKTTEIGGLKPFVTINPPRDSIETLVESHYRFAVSLAEMHPELEFRDVKVENAGNNIYRVTLKILNKGVFATCAEIGDQNMWTRIMRISLDTGRDQTILSGQKVQRVQRLQGGESAEFSWLISGKGRLGITAGAVNTGIINTSLDLK